MIGLHAPLQQMLNPGHHGGGLAGAGHCTDPGMPLTVQHDLLLFNRQFHAAKSTALRPPCPDTRP